MEVEREKVERFSERVSVWMCVCVLDHFLIVRRCHVQVINAASMNSIGFYFFFKFPAIFVVLLIVSFMKLIETEISSRISMAKRYCRKNVTSQY